MEKRWDGIHPERMIEEITNFNEALEAAAATPDQKTREALREVAEMEVQDLVDFEKRPDDCGVAEMTAEELAIPVALKVDPPHPEPDPFVDFHDVRVLSAALKRVG